MKSFLYILIGYITFLPLVYSQEGQLVLTYKSNGHERVLEEGKKIKVYKNEYDKLKGRLTIIDTASIAVESDTVPLDSIFKIETITKDSRPTGILLTTIGSLMIAGGVAALNEINSSSGSSSGGSSGNFDLGPSSDAVSGGVVMMMIIGAGVTGAGINKLVNGANYKSSKWEYSIR